MAPGVRGVRSNGADAGDEAALAAAPDRQGSAPVAVAGERPVDVALEPLAEPAVLDVLGVPADLLVLGQQLGTTLRGAGEPRRLGPVNERRDAAPPVRIGVVVDRKSVGEGRSW